LSEGASHVLPPTCFALLTSLELALKTSQQALLDREVERLEELTHEQLRLRMLLAVAWAENGNQTAESNDPAVVASMQAAVKRVLHLGRIQRALLDRAQRYLRTLSNRMAGVGTPYDPPQSNQGAKLHGNGMPVQKG
jgi:hypothetical protein